MAGGSGRDAGSGRRRSKRGDKDLNPRSNNASARRKQQQVEMVASSRTPSQRRDSDESESEDVAGAATVTPSLKATTSSTLRRPSLNRVETYAFIGDDKLLSVRGDLLMVQNYQTSDILWQVRLETTVTALAQPITKGIIVVALANRHIAALRVKNGKIKWGYRLPRSCPVPYFTTIAHVARDDWIIGGCGPQLFCVGLQSVAELKWSAVVPSDAPITCVMSRDADHIALVGCEDGQVHEVNTWKGEIVSSRSLHSSSVSNIIQLDGPVMCSSATNNTLRVWDYKPNAITALPSYRLSAPCYLIRGCPRFVFAMSSGFVDILSVSDKTVRYVARCVSPKEARPCSSINLITDGQSHPTELHIVGPEDHVVSVNVPALLKYPHVRTLQRYTGKLGPVRILTDLYGSYFRYGTAVAQQVILLLQYLAIFDLSRVSHFSRNVLDPLLSFGFTSTVGVWFFFGMMLLTIIAHYAAPKVWGLRKSCMHSPVMIAGGGLMELILWFGTTINLFPAIAMSWTALWCATTCPGCTSGHSTMLATVNCSPDGGALHAVVGAFTLFIGALGMWRIATADEKESTTGFPCLPIAYRNRLIAAMPHRNAETVFEPFLHALSPNTTRGRWSEFRFVCMFALVIASFWIPSWGAPCAGAIIVAAQLAVDVWSIQYYVSWSNAAHYAAFSIVTWLCFMAAIVIGLDRPSLNAMGVGLSVGLCPVFPLVLAALAYWRWIPDVQPPTPPEVPGRRPTPGQPLFLPTGKTAIASNRDNDDYDDDARSEGSQGNSRPSAAVSRLPSRAVVALPTNDEHFTDDDSDNESVEDEKFFVLLLHEGEDTYGKLIIDDHVATAAPDSAPLSIGQTKATGMYNAGTVSFQEFITLLEADMRFDPENPGKVIAVHRDHNTYDPLMKFMQREMDVEEFVAYAINPMLFKAFELPSGCPPGAVDSVAEVYKVSAATVKAVRMFRSGRISAPEFEQLVDADRTFQSVVVVPLEHAVEYQAGEALHQLKAGQLSMEKFVELVRDSQVFSHFDSHAYTALEVAEEFHMELSTVKAIMMFRAGRVTQPEFEQLVQADIKFQRVNVTELSRQPAGRHYDDDEHGDRDGEESDDFEELQRGKDVVSSGDDEPEDTSGDDSEPGHAAIGRSSISAHARSKRSAPAPRRKSESTEDSEDEVTQLEHMLEDTTHDSGRSSPSAGRPSARSARPSGTRSGSGGAAGGSLRVPTEEELVALSLYAQGSITSAEMVERINKALHKVTASSASSSPRLQTSTPDNGSVARGGNRSGRLTAKPDVTPAEPVAAEPPRPPATEPGLRRAASTPNAKAEPAPSFTPLSRTTSMASTKSETKGGAASTPAPTPAPAPALVEEQEDSDVSDGAGERANGVGHSHTRGHVDGVSSDSESDHEEHKALPAGSKFANSHTGWLLKRGQKMKSWKKRWFVMQDGHLRYYVNPRSKSVQGELLLTTTTLVYEFTPPKDEAHQWSFAVQTATRTLICCAQSSDERREWMTAIFTHITGVE